MRPTAIPQSPLFLPLTAALGTEGRVRVLRVLAESDAPLGLPTLAREAGLNPRGVRTIARELEELGVVMPGPGSRPTLMLRDAWPLTAALRALFAAEAACRTARFADLRRLAGSVAPPPIGVWLAGPHAAGHGTMADPLTVVVHGAPEDLPAQRAALETGLARLAARHDLPAPEVLTLSRAELAAAAPGDAPDGRLIPPLRLLAGTLPDLVPPEARHVVARRAEGHAGADADALARAAALAELVRTSPTLVPRALKSVRERIEAAPPRLRPTLREWAVLLGTQTPARLARLLVRDDARMARLRQTLPFFEVLTAEERARYEAALARRRASAGEVS